MGKIYKIADNLNGQCYVGSAWHVANIKRFLNGKSNYVSSFEVLKYGDYVIILIKKLRVISKRETVSINTVQKTGIILWDWSGWIW